MLLNLQKLWLLCLLLPGLGSAKVRYDGYRVYIVNPASEAQLKELQKLDGAFDSVIFPHGIDGVGQETNVVVAPHKLADFAQIMSDRSIKYELLNTNLQQVLNKERSQSRSYGSNVGYDWSTYYSLEATTRFLKNLTQRFPRESAFFNMGISESGREMSVFIIQLENIAIRRHRPSIFIEAGIYGNEWIAPATATYIIHTLMTTEDEAIKEIARSYNWYIVPFANPDGYEYSFTTDPLWRKNRGKHTNYCHGVDLNRNFGYHWNDDSSAQEPCSNVFAGPAAVSEQETKALTAFVSNLTGLHLYVSLQGYSQKLVYPYGYSNDTPANEEHLKQVLTESIDALKRRYGTKYAGGSMFNTIHQVAGNSIDWAIGSKGVRMAFTYKLGPSADSDYKVSRKVPSTQILPNVVETFDSLMAMVKKVKSLGYFEYKFPRARK